MTSPSAKALLVLTATLFLVSSCKKDGFLTKDERKVLFAAPVTTEPDAVLTGWQQRSLEPADYTVMQDHEIAGGQYRLRIVSFRLDGMKQYGALLVPETSVSLPVRMQIGGFGLGLTTNSVNLVAGNTAPASPSILAIPALRGQSLEVTINGTVYTSPVSEGEHCNAFDGATDDVIAFLNLIQQTEPRADVNRTAVRGGSRGGTVALLAGIRDARIKRVVDVAGPTDMLELTAQHENDPTYRCQFLDAFKNGQSTIAATRSKMIASSPLYFARRLPLTQLHMGLKDKNVPVIQAYNLEKALTREGMSSQLQLYTYDRAHTDIATNNPELAARIEEFLSHL